MKEYKTIKIRFTAKKTENLLNQLVEEGWKVVCSYAQDGRYLILEREKQNGGKK